MIIINMEFLSFGERCIPPIIRRGIGNFAGGIFLLSGGNLTRSDFGHFNLFQNFWKSVKAKFRKYWTSIKIKIGMTSMYKDYELEIKMVPEQWLQLKMKSLWRCNMKIVIHGGRGGRLMRGNKNLVGEGYCRRGFSSGGTNKILAYGGTPIFSSGGNGGVPPVGETLIFRLLLF